MDLILEARAFIQGELRDVEIGLDLESGTIAAVKKTLPGSPRKRYRGQILLPSGVDWHVHFRDPGAPHKEDFRTGTQSAALGGVGTVLDMPNTSPLVDRASRLREKMELVAPKACVDWGLWATATRQTTDIASLLRDAIGLKVFLTHTTNVDVAPSNAELEDILMRVNETRRWVVIHAEGTALPGASRGTPDHDARKPAHDEARAIHRVSRVAPEPAHVHIAHVSSPEALEAAEEAGFSIGATPNHLLLSHDQMRDAHGKVNPPLRSAAQRKQLWDAFVGGRIRHVESDHAPHTAQEKSAAFEEAPAGIPGVQTQLPLLLWRVKRGELPLARLMDAAAINPAAKLGLPGGRLEAGLQANFFLIDPSAPTRVRGADLASKAGWSPYEGWEALFPTAHYLRGELIVEDSAFVGKPGQGRRIAPGPAKPAALQPAATTSDGLT